MVFDYFSESGNFHPTTNYGTFGEQLADSKKKSKYKESSNFIPTTSPTRVQANYTTLPVPQRQSKSEKRIAKTFIRTNTSQSDLMKVVDESKKKNPEKFKNYSIKNFEYMDKYKNTREHNPYGVPLNAIERPNNYLIAKEPVIYQGKIYKNEEQNIPRSNQYNDMFVKDAPGYDRLDNPDIYNKKYPNTKPNVSKNSNQPNIGKGGTSKGKFGGMPTLAQMQDYNNYANPNFYEPPRRRTLGDTGGYTIIDDRAVYESNPTMLNINERRGNEELNFKKALNEKEKLNNLPLTTSLTLAQKKEAFNPIYIKPVSTAEQSKRSTNAGTNLASQINALDKLASGGVKVNTDIFTPSGNPLKATSLPNIQKTSTPILNIPTIGANGKKYNNVAESIKNNIAVAPTKSQGMTKGITLKEPAMTQKQFSENIKLVSGGFALGDTVVRKAIADAGASSASRLKNLHNANLSSGLAALYAHPDLARANSILLELDPVATPITVTTVGLRHSRVARFAGPDPTSVVETDAKNRAITAFGMEQTDIRPLIDFNMNVSAQKGEMAGIVGRGSWVRNFGGAPNFVATGPVLSSERMQSYTSSNGRTRYGYTTVTYQDGVSLRPEDVARYGELAGIVGATGTSGIYAYANQVRSVSQKRKESLSPYIDPLDTEGGDSIFNYATIKEKEIEDIKQYSSDLNKLSNDYDTNIDILNQGVAKVQTVRGKAPKERVVSGGYSMIDPLHKSIESREKPFDMIIGAPGLSNVEERITSKKTQIEARQNTTTNFNELMKQGMFAGLTPHETSPENTLARIGQIDATSKAIDVQNTRLTAIQAEVESKQMKVPDYRDWYEYVDVPSGRSRTRITSRHNNSGEVEAAKAFNAQQYVPYQDEKNTITKEISELSTYKTTLENTGKQQGYLVSDVMKVIENNLPSLAPQNIDKVNSFKTMLGQFGSDFIGGIDGGKVIELRNASFGGGGSKVNYGSHVANGTLVIPKELVPISGKVILEATGSYSSSKKGGSAIFNGVSIPSNKSIPIQIEVPVDADGKIQISGSTSGNMNAQPFTLSNIKIRDSTQQSTLNNDLWSLQSEQTRLQTRLNENKSNKTLYDNAQLFLLGNTNRLTDDDNDEIVSYNDNKLTISNEQKFKEIYGKVNTDIFGGVRMLSSPLGKLESDKQSILQQKQKLIADTAMSEKTPSTDAKIIDFDSRVKLIDDSKIFLTSNVPQLILDGKVVATRNQAGQISIVDQTKLSSIGLQFPDALLNKYTPDTTVKISVLEQTVAQKEEKQKQLIAELKIVQKERIKENAVARQAQIQQLLNRRVINRHDAAKMRNDINNEVLSQNTIIDGVDGSVPLPDITEFDEDLKSEAQKIIENTGKIASQQKRANAGAQLRQVTRSRQPQSSIIGSYTRVGQTVPRPSDDRPQRASTTLGANLTSGSVMDA